MVSVTRFVRPSNGLRILVCAVAVLAIMRLPMEATGPNSMEESKNPDRITIVLRGAKIEITLRDAETIRQALEAYIQNHAAELDHSLPSDLRPIINHSTGEPWIDADGQMHIGLWVLGKQLGREEMALSMWPARRVETGAGIQFVADLQKKNKHWSIGRITYAIWEPARKPIVK